MRGLRRRVAGLAAAGSLLAGCVTVGHEPALPMPERPVITFYQHKAGGPVCLSEQDAEALFRYVRKLNEFEAARERLLRD